MKDPITSFLASLPVFGSYSDGTKTPAIAEQSLVRYY